MRHRIHGAKLGRKTAHRQALLKNLSLGLILSKNIRTTLPKAKALREFLEPLITRAKVDSVHNRRQVFAKLRNDEAVGILFLEISPKSKDRPGGYIRILKHGYRSGDNAPMAFVQLVDFAPEVESSQESA